MPEVYFQIQWPNGEVSNCYSPSRVAREYFHAGTVLRVDEFVKKSAEALERANDRVQQKFGYRCSSAAAQLEEIVAKAKAFHDNEKVRILHVD